MHNLNHNAWIKKKSHTVTWWGDLSYSKLKIEKEPETSVCPLCNLKLEPLSFFKHGEPPPPDEEIEMFVDSDVWSPKFASSLYYTNKGIILS